MPFFLLRCIVSSPLRATLIAVALCLVIPSLVYPQDQPLRVEVIGDSRGSLDPIDVTVTNISSRSIDLAVPANIVKSRRESFRNPLPMDVERHSGGTWVVTRPRGTAGVSRAIKPGQTLTFRLGVGGAGEYRVRVWYVVDHNGPYTPKQKPNFGSVLSRPFEIHANI
jgi:hypothetical protein